MTTENCAAVCATFFSALCHWANLVNCWERAWTWQKKPSPRKSSARNMRYAHSRRSQNHTNYNAEHYHLSLLPQRHLPSFNLIKVINFLFVELSPTLLLCNSSMQSAKTHKQLQITLLENFFSTFSHTLPKASLSLRSTAPATFEVMSLYGDSSAEFVSFLGVSFCM